MLHHIPRHLPPLSTMLDDIGRPSDLDLSRRLGVHPRTVRRWRRADAAPRPVLLALFWVTRWGVDAVDCLGRVRLALDAPADAL